MLVDDDGHDGVVGGMGGGGGGARRISAGMAGLLDAGIISEGLPAPSHRVQAWDFTTGTTPDIADSEIILSVYFTKFVPVRPHKAITF